MVVVAAEAAVVAGEEGLERGKGWGIGDIQNGCKTDRMIILLCLNPVGHVFEVVRYIVKAADLCLGEGGGVIDFLLR